MNLSVENQIPHIRFTSSGKQIENQWIHATVIELQINIVCDVSNRPRCQG